ncbi:MAG: FtsX-like permease family protein [Promethearchaeota archaeon]|nr:MAG: FtsX-like permease family protein [Candidatus Lokiarchaeota archaeon]
MTNIKLIFKYAFKDLFSKHKVRTILGIVGIMISISLLCLVLFLGDSLSVGFVDYLTTNAGGQDMVISVRHYNGEPENRSNYFAYNPIINDIRAETSGIENFIPRMEVLGKVNISESFESQNLTNEEKSVMISGIDFSHESAIGFGTFIKPGTEQKLNLNSLNSTSCAIYYEFNEDIKYKAGDIIEIRMKLTDDGSSYISKNLTVSNVFDFNLKWPSSYRNDNLICVSIDTLYELFGQSEFNGTCSKLIGIFEKGNQFYDIRSVDASEDAVLNLASEVQLAIGIEEYDIELPKLRILQFSEIVSMIFTIAIIFVSVITMLISGVLINGILKTSVEERIREFGIFRTLGAHKLYNVATVLVQGLILCNVGTIIGILGSFFVTQYLVIPFANQFLLSEITALGGATLSFNFTWFSIIAAYLIGVIVGLIVSLSPAIKVLKLNLIESIHPYRHPSEIFKLQKKSSFNYKLILVGLILAITGGFIYFIIPRIIVSLDITLMGTTLIIVLIIFLLGMTLAGLGIMPVVLRFVIQLFRPLSKKLHNVIQTFIYRYQRRNTSTIVIFAISFSFVMFTSIFIDDLSSMMESATYIGSGSDLLIESTGWSDDSSGGLFGGGMMMMGQQESTNEEINVDKLFTTDFENILMDLQEIEKVSSALVTPDQLTEIYADENKEFSAEIGDYAGLSSQPITLIGIDGKFQSTINTKYLNYYPSSAFDLIQSVDQNYCIISESIANQLNLRNSDKIRIVINRGEEVERFIFHVAGIASSIPGFPGLFSASTMGGGGGVLVSHNKFIDIMEISEPTWVDKIFIKLRQSNSKAANNLEVQISRNYSSQYDFEIDNLISSIQSQKSTFSIVNSFFSLILMSTVIICLFGLLSSSYSSIIERKKEIGIVRTLGLKGKGINRLFIIEALIIMLSSGTVGVIVGCVTGWLFGSSMSVFMDTPYSLYFPWFNFFAIYGVAILFVYVGMKFLLWRMKRKKITEIYRETT